VSQPAFLSFSHVSFSYEGQTVPPVEDLTATFSAGWTGFVGANGSGKTTLLRLAAGELTPVSGTIQGQTVALYCPQRTDFSTAEIAEFLESEDGSAWRLRGLLGIEDEWLERWETLSHGERKRAQIASALWRSPGIVAMDEPTNHLDRLARNLVAEALKGYTGVGLLVSHDRDLLDALCSQCLFIDPPEIILRPGGYTDGARQQEIDRFTAQRHFDQTRLEMRRLRRETQRRREKAQQADSKKSKRGIRRKDHDAKEKIDRARVTGKDASAGKQLRQIQGRLRQAELSHAQTTVKKEVEMGIWVEGSRSKRDTLFRLEEARLSLGGRTFLECPNLVMTPRDRVALVGPNGSGKSTLMDLILRSLNLGKNRTLYLPQEVTAEDSRRIAGEARRLPREELGRVMVAISRLGSNPERVLETRTPSPGEIRKLLLAIGIARVPHLIAMDEPTNHLDLPSIECLEQALADCPCALFLISHDYRFLRGLASTVWVIEEMDREQKRGHGQEAKYQLRIEHGTGSLEFP
jgi:ATPase subunit of ABC transporter with duplicated ATPase domains